MSEVVKGTVRGKTIDLEKTLALPDGSRVLLSVQPLPISTGERRRAILDLCGAWKGDPSLGAIFEKIAKERAAHKERQVRIV